MTNRDTFSKQDVITAILACVPNERRCRALLQVYAALSGNLRNSAAFASYIFANPKNSDDVIADVDPDLLHRAVHILGDREGRAWVGMLLHAAERRNARDVQVVIHLMKLRLAPSRISGGDIL